MADDMLRAAMAKSAAASLAKLASRIETSNVPYAGKAAQIAAIQSVAALHQAAATVYASQG